MKVSPNTTIFWIKTDRSLYRWHGFVDSTKTKLSIQIIFDSLLIRAIDFKYPSLLWVLPIPRETRWTRAICSGSQLLRLNLIPLTSIVQIFVVTDTPNFLICYLWLRLVLVYIWHIEKNGISWRLREILRLWAQLQDNDNNRPGSIHGLFKRFRQWWK